MALEVLNEMRLYLLTPDGEDRMVKEERIKASIENLVNDPLGQKIVLRLEPAPLVSSDIDKGKGIVFNFDHKVAINTKLAAHQRGHMLMASAIGSGIAVSLHPVFSSTQSKVLADNCNWKSIPFSESSMVYGIGTLSASSSGTSLIKKKQRKCSPKSKRKLKGKIDEGSVQEV